MRWWCAVLCGVLCAEGAIELPATWQTEHCLGSPPVTVAGGTVVALATDSKNQLPIMGVVNSSLANAKRPDLISFVVITRHVHSLKRLLDAFLPGARVAICGGMAEILMKRPALSGLMRLANSTRIKRKELLSPFNFAAFYLPYVLSTTSDARVLYLDTDVVVTGDVGELAAMDMRGFPAGAVEDCSQQVTKYVNMDLFLAANDETWKLSKPDASTCVFNRGVVLFDSKRWRDLHLTETIEELVEAFVASKAKLWRGGVSQPPFLLALTGRYLKLDISWNVRGLGRMDIGRSEWLLLAEDAARRYGVRAPASFFKGVPREDDDDARRS